MAFLFYTTIVLFILVCSILIALVLLQKGRGGGLAGAFGGGGGNTAFGAKTGDVLTWATSVVFGIFILLAIALNLLANHRQSQKQLAAQGLTGTTTTDQPTGNLPLDLPIDKAPIEAAPTTTRPDGAAATTPAAPALPGTPAEVPSNTTQPTTR